MVEQRIGAAPERVAAYVMDPANDPSWIRALTEVNVLTEGPLGAGTRVQRVASFLGKRIEYVNEIEEYEPPRRLAMRSVEAPFPMTVVYELDPAGEGTLMRISTGGDTGGFYKLAAPLLAAQVRRGVAGDLRKLKEILEG